MTYGSIARQWLGKYIPAEANARNIRTSGIAGSNLVRGIDLFQRFSIYSVAPSSKENLAEMTIWD
jgi:hypothetical protein